MTRHINTTTTGLSRIALHPLFSLMMVLALLFVGVGCSADTVSGGMEGEGEVNDTTPPSISIVNPVANAELKGEFTLQASVTDDGTIAKVDYYADGELIGTSAAAPWTFVWNTVTPGDGPVTLQAKAFDAANNQGVSTTVPVKIKNGLALRFTNTTSTSVTIAPSGQSQRVVAAGKSTTFTYDTNPGSVSYKANTKGQYGLSLFWDARVTTGGNVSETVSISVGSGFFFLRGRNTSSRETSSLYVNFQASNEKKVKPFTLGSSTKDLGYFKGSGATRIRIYAKYKFGDLGPVYWDFASDINNRTSTFGITNAAAAKQSTGENETNLDVLFESEETPTQEEGTVHYPTSSEEIVY